MSEAKAMMCTNHTIQNCVAGDHHEGPLWRRHHSVEAAIKRALSSKPTYLPYLPSNPNQG